MGETANNMRNITYDESWLRDQETWARAWYLNDCLFRAGFEHINMDCGLSSIEICVYAHSEEERTSMENTILHRMAEGETLVTTELDGLKQPTYAIQWKRDFENWKDNVDE